MKTFPRSFPRPRRPALVTPGDGVEMAASTSDFVRRGALAILAFGVARLVRYFADRSLWLDESLLTINLMTRSYRELLETLDYNQGAPIAFLWIERLMLDLFGDSEYCCAFSRC